MHYCQGDGISPADGNSRTSSHIQLLCSITEVDSNLQHTLAVIQGQESAGWVRGIGVVQRQDGMACEMRGNSAFGGKRRNLLPADIGAQVAKGVYVNNFPLQEIPRLGTGHFFEASTDLRRHWWAKH